MRSSEVTVRPEPGTYALFCSCHKHALIEAGCLGRFQLRPGFYVYVGSALGLGGLRSRLAHHEKPSKKPHWHIDYLRAHAQPQRVWYTYGLLRREHQWATAFRTVPNGLSPLPGFGSSDCNCESHLFFFQSLPSLRSFTTILRTTDPAHPRVRQRIPR